MSVPHNPLTADQLEAERLANIMLQAMRQPLTDNAPPAGPTRAMTNASTPAVNRRQIPIGTVFPLDPTCVGPSRFANRHSFNWEGEAFERFKRSIAARGGNIQPIKVRPAPLGSPVSYEIVYGQRRHRACLDLGLPVRVIVEPVDDLELFRQMCASNEGGKDCTPYEKGLLYIAAIKAGFYSTHDDLANAVGLDNSTVSKQIKLAALPDRVVTAFGSPKGLRVNWGAALHKALSEDEERVLTCAERIAAIGKPTDPKQVFDALCGVEPLPGASGLRREIRIRKGGRPWASIDVPTPALGEGIRVHFKPGAVDEAALEAALRALAASM